MKCPYCRCIRDKYQYLLFNIMCVLSLVIPFILGVRLVDAPAGITVLLFAMFTDLYVLFISVQHKHSWTFAAVPKDRSKHQVPTKHTTFSVFDIWLHVETCRCCYNLCRKLLLFSLRAIWYMCTLLYVYCKSQPSGVNLKCR